MLAINNMTVTRRIDFERRFGTIVAAAVYSLNSRNFPKSIDRPVMVIFVARTRPKSYGYAFGMSRRNQQSVTPKYESRAFLLNFAFPEVDGPVVGVGNMPVISITIP